MHYHTHKHVHVTHWKTFRMNNLKTFYHCNGQNQSKCCYTCTYMYTCTCQGISSALKSRTLSNLMCIKYIYRSKWVDRFGLIKALSRIVEGGQNDSQMPVCTDGPTVKNRFWPLILTSYLPQKFISEYKGFNSHEDRSVYYSKENFYMVSPQTVFT